MLWLLLLFGSFNFLQVLKMSLPVTAFFALGTGVELYGLKFVSDSISILNTVSLVMLTFLIGIIVSQSYGKEVFEKMQRHLKSREAPGDEALNGAVMGVAGMLLITPGAVTDIIGILIMIPLTRGMFKQIALNVTKNRIQSGQPYFFFKD
tara:strand:- start:15 stop:464 length:450 start_codon:yes stop_codon:yes gene_type:complete